MLFPSRQYHKILKILRTKLFFFLQSYNTIQNSFLSVENNSKVAEGRGQGSGGRGDSFAWFPISTIHSGNLNRKQFFSDVTTPILKKITEKRLKYTI